nr:MAG: nonstructural protein [Microvirus sp.]
MLKVFAVRDVKADAFGNLICVPTKGLAVRAFADACADARSPMAMYPEDHSLYEVGEYDPNSGTIKGHALPQLVISASEVLSQSKKSIQEVPA